MRFINNKDKILELFYTYHLKEIQIAEHLAVSQQYVSKIIKANECYIEEMKTRKDANAEKRKLYLAEYHKNYTRSKNEDIIYEWLKAQHDIDVKELSYGSSLYDETYKKYNSSAYKYNGKKHRFELDKKLTCSNDIPKYVHTNATLRPQKYKKPCYAIAH